MKIKIGGIHKRLQFLIEQTGGYDYRYHAQKIGKEYNLNPDDVARIMELSNSVSNPKAQYLFNLYLNKLQEGYPLSIIESMEKSRIRRLTEQLITNYDVKKHLGGM